MEPWGRGSQPHLHVPWVWVCVRSPQPRWDQRSKERLEAGCLRGGCQFKTICRGQCLTGVSAGYRNAVMYGNTAAPTSLACAPSCKTEDTA